MRTDRQVNDEVPLPKKKTAIKKVKPVDESEALQLMWLYYSSNKATLVSDIRESREYILSRIIQGIPIEIVFAEFLLPPKQTKK